MSICRLWAFTVHKTVESNPESHNMSEFRMYSPHLRIVGDSSRDNLYSENKGPYQLQGLRISTKDRFPNDTPHNLLS